MLSVSFSNPSLRFSRSGLRLPCMRGARIRYVVTKRYPKSRSHLVNCGQTVSAVSTFFIAMLHSPSSQAAAQAEIERVVGVDRLPNYNDRDSLPYVEALYKEVLRWQPLAPLGLPHKYTADQDDEYNGTGICPCVL
jgi:hypothetical protein